MNDKVKTWIKTLIIISIIFTIIASISLLFAGEPEDNRVDGTYNLISIQGTQNVTANSYDNYLILDNGVCTLHLSLSNPAGSSTHTFYYTGNTSDSIKFEKSYIRMDYNKNVVLILNYENGNYNIFTYKKIASDN